MSHKFGKIGVVLGGLSSERDISLKSGNAVFEALLKEGCDVEKIDLNTENPNIVEDIIRNSGVGVAFIVMHGRFGEDGRLQAILEKMQMPYVGSDSLASALAMDKIASRNIFSHSHIPTPEYKVLKSMNRDKVDIRGLNLPLVVKPQSEGSSIGVSFVEDMADLETALDEAFKYGNNVIIEEYIEGKELTVSILDGQALEPIEIASKNKFFDFQAKYNKGFTEYILPATISEKLRVKVQEVSLKAARALGCRHLCRVDLLLNKKENPFVLEINTIPGFTSTSLFPKAALYSGMSFGQLCLKLLDMAVAG